MHCSLAKWLLIALEYGYLSLQHLTHRHYHCFTLPLSYQYCPLPMFLNKLKVELLILKYAVFSGTYCMFDVFKFAFKKPICMLILICLQLTLKSILRLGLFIAYLKNATKT